MLGILTKALPLVKGAGRLVGALKHDKVGYPLRGRRVRLMACLTVLLVALLSWVDLPKDVAVAVADVVMELAVESAVEAVPE